MTKPVELPLRRYNTTHFFNYNDNLDQAPDSGSLDGPGLDQLVIARFQPVPAWAYSLEAQTGLDICTLGQPGHQHPSR